VRGFTECLRHELAATPVRVSCVHPGGIRTAIARHARIGAGVTRTGLEQKVAQFEKLFRTSAEEAASRILRGVERSEPRILIGSDAYQIDVVQRLRPGTYWKTLAKVFAKLAAKAK
jgi:short-subunit dehydrogenase